MYSNHPTESHSHGPPVPPKIPVSKAHVSTASRDSRERPLPKPVDDEIIAPDPSQPPRRLTFAPLLNPTPGRKPKGQKQGKEEKGSNKVGKAFHKFKGAFSRKTRRKSSIAEQEKKHASDTVDSLGQRSSNPSLLTVPGNNIPQLSDDEIAELIITDNELSNHPISARGQRRSFFEMDAPRLPPTPGSSAPPPVPPKVESLKLNKLPPGAREIMPLSNGLSESEALLLEGLDD